MDAVRTFADENADAIAQFAGYIAVSGAAFVVDFSMYWVLLKFAKFAFVAACGGYVFGVLCHYALSSRIVFKTRFAKRGLKHEAPAVMKFFAAGATGLVVTAAVVGLLADVMGVHPLIAKLVAAGCSFGAVFLSLRLFVFNEPTDAAARPT
jgi:putative flippase GtrA